jgi:hypothetical protein
MLNADEANPGGEASARPDVCQRLVDGCSEDEFANMRCPVCNGHLVLHPRGRSFSIRCKTNALHLMKHGTTEKAPKWWAKWISGGWLD